jgi:hypothetical protein
VFTLVLGISRDRAVHPCPGWSRPPIMRNTRRSSLSPPPSPCSFTAVATLSTPRDRPVEPDSKAPARSRSARQDRRRPSQTPGRPEHLTHTRRGRPTTPAANTQPAPAADAQPAPAADAQPAPAARYRPGLLVDFLAKILLDLKFAYNVVFRGLMLSALAARRAAQIAEHLSAHNSETVSSRDEMIISYQSSVK